ADVFGGNLAALTSGTNPRRPEAFNSRAKRPSFSAQPNAAIPDVEVPGAGKISLGAFVQWLKGNPARIRGSLTRAGDQFQLSIHYAPPAHANPDQLPFSVTLPVSSPANRKGTPLSIVTLLAAEETTRHISPYTAAAYYYQGGETEKAIAA